MYTFETNTKNTVANENQNKLQMTGCLYQILDHNYSN